MSQKKLGRLVIESAIVITVAVPSLAPAASIDRAFTDVFGEDPKDFASTGRSPYCVLEPGYVLVLGGQEKGKQVELRVTVLHETRVVDGVETRVLEERESVDGRTTEVSRNFLAISRRTNNVYYFGEETAEEQGGKLVPSSDVWHSGEKGARYGLFMPATPLLGARYHQEIARGQAMDRAEIVSLSETFEAPAGRFDHVLKVEETTPLEPAEKEYKLYAAGIGLIYDDGLKLERIEEPTP